MPGIALDSAKKGRLRPSFFFLLGLCGSVWAQQVVFRCGQEYTNAPLDPNVCERMAPQAITVIPGTRVQSAQPPGAAAFTAPVPPGTSAGAVSGASQSQRDDMARSIVSAELHQARQRHAQLEQEYRQGQPLQTPQDEQDPRPAQAQQAQQERAARFRAALERSQRDIESLQRELARRPAVSATP